MLSHIRAALVRVRELFRRRSRAAAEQNEEFSFHVEMETAENMRRGMREDDARRAALLRFGGTQRFREETSDLRGVIAIDNLARDTRFAIRRLRRPPGFAIGVIATLGIGIGGAVGIGSIVYDVLLRDLPYDKPEQLVRVGLTMNAATTGDLQPPSTYFHFAKSAQSFSALGVYFTSDAFNVTDGDAPERVTVALMTPNIFTLLGVRPLLGQSVRDARYIVDGRPHARRDHDLGRFLATAVRSGPVDHRSSHRHQPRRAHHHRRPSAVVRVSGAIHRSLLPGDDSGQPSTDRVGISLGHRAFARRRERGSRGS